MKTLTLAALTLTCFCTHAIPDTFGTGANHFEIDFAEISDPGNEPDTSRVLNPAGAVDYVYNISKFEISRDMVEKASAEGGLGLTLDTMDFVAGGPRPEMPATGLSWNEAARFTNWLNTSHGAPPAYKFSRQPGEAGYDANANIELWVDGDPGFDAAKPFRNRQAKYFFPSVDEWHKAAYYDPAVGRYWNFPTGSDVTPTAVTSGTDPNTAVYDAPSFFQGPADISRAGGLSPYGVMGLGGNVGEWQETEAEWGDDWTHFASSPTLNARSVLGGYWREGDLRISASNTVPLGNFPDTGFSNIGFRVASVPEPDSQLLGLTGMVGFLLRRQRANYKRATSA